MNALALQDFFVNKFPEFAQRKFFVTGGEFLSNKKEIMKDGIRTKHLFVVAVKTLTDYSTNKNLKIDIPSVISRKLRRALHPNTF